MTSEAAKKDLITSSLRILAIETSAEICSIGVSLFGEVTIAENKANQNHSEHVLPMIDNLLEINDLSLGDIDVIGFGAGPGSFTGVRLACSVAQGLAFGVNIPVVPVPSLEALAQKTNRDKILVCQDARMSQVYAAAFERIGDIWVPMVDPYVCDPQDVTIPDGDGWVACGSGFVSYKEVFETSKKFSIPILNGEYIRSTAREVLKITCRDFLAGKAVSAEDAIPTYVRNKVALTLNEQVSSR